MDTSIKKKILLIEDDTETGNLYATKLRMEGFEVQVVASGTEGVAVMKEYKPDLVLLDLMMAKRSGFEVLQEVRDDDSLSGIPIVVLTNISSGEDRERTKALGAVEYLVKIDSPPDAVAKKVSEILEDRR